MPFCKGGKKMKKRSFRELSKNMTLGEFDSFCKRIAESYANSEAKFARTYYTEHENISISCFYKVLERAVVLNLVSEKTVDKMEKKAELNQSLHAKGAGITSKEKYEELRKKRNEYIIFLYSDEEIKKLATDFANNPQITKTEFAKKYEVSTNVIDTLLKKAITENLIADEIFAKIEERSLAKNSSLRAKEFFKILHERRNSNLKGTVLD